MTLHRHISPGIFVALLACSTLPLRGEDNARSSPVTPANPVTKTMGGTQFWSDELVFRGWRIQQNVLTGHYRLLDESDYRQASGTFDECRRKLEELRTARDLKPMQGPAVVTLHGLIRSRDMMEGIGKYLEQEGDYLWLNVSYASTRRTLDDHAASLARVIDHLEGVTEIHFVCHSLGNLVVRRYVGEAAAAEPKWKVDPRIKRMVMLGPPNHGARFANYFKDSKVFDLVLGPAGKQLAAEWSDVEKRLAVPPFEFGIIAGSASNGRLKNPLLDGDDDLVVKVEETRLPGACDFLVVPCSHGDLMDDPHVRRCVRRFLQEGCFEAADKRMPIIDEKKPAAAPQQATP
jgi:pimeloyl-ACP methyl ester carboxylesterase